MECRSCNKSIPNKYLRDYKYLYLSPLCPLCARKLTNKLNRPFKKEELYEDFISQGEFKLKKPWGGHMINPPESCSYGFIDEDQGHWVDLACCAQLCKDRCQRRKDFRMMTRGEKKQELENNGVRTV